MNKITKGVIAGAAGLVLLTGGAGTFAAWNTSAAVSGGTVTTGHLTITGTTTPTWTDKTPGAATTAIGTSLSSYSFAPGDSVEGATTLAVAAQGRNLVADFTATSPSLTLSATDTAGLASTNHSDPAYIQAAKDQAAISQFAIAAHIDLSALTGGTTDTTVPAQPVVSYTLPNGTLKVHETISGGVTTITKYEISTSGDANTTVNLPILIDVTFTGAAPSINNSAQDVAPVSLSGVTINLKQTAADNTQS